MGSIRVDELFGREVDATPAYSGAGSTAQVFPKDFHEMHRVHPPFECHVFERQLLPKA